MAISCFVAVSRETPTQALDSFRQHLQARSASRRCECAQSAQRTPRQNHILAALPLHEYERLLPELKPVALPLGCVVHGAGDRQGWLCFVTAGIVSRSYVTQHGASTAFAVTGSEGVIGVASFLGGDSMPSRAVVVSAGQGYRLGTGPLTNEFKHDGLLPRLLLRYTQALLTQTGQIAVCNRLNSVEQQLCRWILTFLDRSSGNELAMTQELIADLLGVRRESVTEAAGKLQEAGLIHYSRGHIAVLDRPRLQAHVCECYGVVRREYDRLLGRQNIHGLRTGSGDRESVCLANHGA